MIGVGIIGCGGIGKKRMTNLAGAQVTACADIVRERAEMLAGMTPNASAYTDWQDVIRRDDVQVVMVATTNNLLAEISCAALEHGKHVLVEKPAAQSVAELDRVITAAQKARRLVRVGFNHRYHPALCKARELFEAGALGPLMFIRGRYGHGGRIGYEKEWRADPAKSGGGARSLCPPDS